MSSSLRSSRIGITLGCQANPRGEDVVDQPTVNRRRLIRCLSWLFACGAIIFAVATIHRALRAMELRSLAVDASDALHAGQWQRLENVSRRWQEKDPNAGMAWLLAAQAADQLQSPGRMATYIERMPEHDPGKPAALLEAATAYFGPLNQPALGEAACLKSLELQPDNVEARRRLIFYYCMTLQRAKMVQFARDAIAAGNDTPETYVYLLGADWITLSNAADYNGKWLLSADSPETFLVAYLVHWAGAAGVDSVEPSSESQPGNDAQSDPRVLSRIASILAGDRPSLALRDNKQRMVRSMEIYPQNVELLAFQLREASSEGAVDRVADLLARVPAAAAGDNRFFHYKGWLHETLGEDESAIEAYRQALAVNPFDWRSQLKLAGVLRLVGDVDQADRLATLGVDGKNLRETIMRLVDVQSIPMPVLVAMLDYCKRCEDDLVASALAKQVDRIQRITKVSS